MLGEFLLAAARDTAPWNCSTMPADWCIRLGHPDFAAAWRHLVEDAECAAAQIDAGGLAILWGRGIGDAIPEVSAPFARGDIGVISLHGFEAGAIFTGDKWALRGKRSIVCSRLSDEAVVAAWRP